jgi:hypothetical protein
MFVCIMNHVHNLSHNTHVQSTIYQEFYHSIVYLVNEGSRIKNFETCFFYDEMIIPILKLSNLLF